MEKLAPQQMSPPQPKVEYWCYICETVIEASIESPVIEKCTLCNGQAIERITPENDPRRFTPPIRQSQSQLISPSRDQSAAAEPYPDFPEHIPNESETRSSNGRNHPFIRKHLSANRHIRIQWWQVDLSERCQFPHLAQ